MPEIDWSALREALVAHFEEDTVQQALLDLLEVQARGTVVLNPLHWCRMRARQIKSKLARRAQVEREAVADLGALKTAYPEVRRRYRKRAG